MEADFWKQRWHLGETGFHKSQVNPLLTHWWPFVRASQGAPVLVPLCGKSLDMHWLVDRGHTVIGVELARKALQEFAAEQALAFEWTITGPFEKVEGQGYRLYCGDFFALTASDVGSVQVVYDRAALIALPGRMREEYAAHMRRILPPRWTMLLVTLDYPQAQRAGPPFSVSDEEVRRLFAGCDIALLDNRDVLDEHQMFRSQGMTELHERVYLIEQT
ncbi:MAG TPA: thiopurine S-methyltransferase [Pseudomonas xinjiangensis]|uniref:Thiopurine S-methyltransferase n=2 Tax=root TaxID=1 RepID=A0A7V1FT69_9GAMM|nr:thiopurine S-methyltransferase [Halopseudomonas xinjiangensis]HEC46271.1 thiopurine S-methyltransferase [Halopseudomonas xinjiangensis]